MANNAPGIAVNEEFWTFDTISFKFLTIDSVKFTWKRYSQCQIESYENCEKDRCCL